MSQPQPIDRVKSGLENVLPAAYLAGIALVYIASATVMSFLIYPPLLKVIGNSGGAIIAAVAVHVAIQFMRFLIVFTDSLTSGKNDSVFVVWMVSIAMLVISVIEVFVAVEVLGADKVIAVTCSSLMFAGCVLELLFVKKLNRRDLEIEAATSKATAKSPLVSDPLLADLIRELQSLKTQNGHVQEKL